MDQYIIRRRPTNRKTPFPSTSSSTAAGGPDWPRNVRCTRRPCRTRRSQTRTRTSSTMTISMTRTPLYKQHFGTNCPKVRQAPPVWAAFFMSGYSPEKWRLYAVLFFCHRHFADPRCGPRRWPWRVGRGKPAGRIWFRQPRRKCSCVVK